MSDWRIIQQGDYFHHEYGHTWNTEREIEIAVALRWLNENPTNLIEVGAVMPYYSDISHEVIDPYDSKATITDFMENHDLSLMNVLSISTIEHIGMTDYVVRGETQNIVDELAAVEALKQILNQSDNCLVSIPIGYNHILDGWLERNLSKLNCFGYKKVSWMVNGQVSHQRVNTPQGVKSLWEYYENVNSISGEKYGSPFHCANYVLFIEGWG